MSFNMVEIILGIIASIMWVYILHVVTIDVAPLLHYGVVIIGAIQSVIITTLIIILFNIKK